ncbi:hypothetical protein D3C85_1586140 [compost metagenome]
MHHQRLIPIEIGISPHRFIDLFFGHHLAQMPDQVHEDLELFASKDNLAARLLVLQPVLPLEYPQVSNLQRFSA